MIRSLDALAPAGDGGAVLKLGPDECRQWLGALNDLRLAIGTRLEVTDEEDSASCYRLPDERPAQADGDGLPLARRAPGDARRDPDALTCEAYCDRFVSTQRSLSGCSNPDNDRITARRVSCGIVCAFVRFFLWCAPHIA